MSCDEPIIAPGGRSGIGVIQPQSGLDYPLVAPSEDIRYLIADFYLAYDDPGLYNANDIARKHPLRIKWLYGVGCEPAAAPGWAPTPVHAADILIIDALENTVFDSTQLVPAGGDEDYQNFQVINWGDDLVIYEWIGNNGVCRLVVYKTWPPAFEIAPKDWPTHIAPDNAVLDERAVYKMPRRVRSLKVFSDNIVSGTVQRRGAVFSTGYNMRIETAASTGTNLRNNTNISFNAEPGAGLGKYSDCPDFGQAALLNINGSTPNKYGDFTMSGPSCFWVRQPTQIEDGSAIPQRYNNAATLDIGSNCGPCCDCPDYVETGLYMNRVAARYNTVGKAAHKVKLLHEENIARWLEQRDCILSRPLRLIFVPQNCPFLDIVMMYCNQCEKCAENVTLSLTLSNTPNDAVVSVQCGYTFLYAPGYSGVSFSIGGSYPTFTASLPPIDIGNSAYVKFRLRFRPASFPVPRAKPYFVTGTLTSTSGGNPLMAGCDETAPAAAATADATLNCALDGSTIGPC